MLNVYKEETVLKWKMNVCVKSEQKTHKLEI